MAEVGSQNVVNQTQSAGDFSPSDAPATTSNDTFTEGDAGEEVSIKENGFHIHPRPLSRTDDQILEDGTARSDTDTSRAEGSVTEDNKSVELKPVKKFVASKPVSFAKYSVPKVIAANAAKGTADKANIPNALVPAAQPVGRPRLVAKTTSSLQPKVKPFRAAGPDPMQVWNKNRATPQPSTKHLTDEELKQQYGIHLTSRLQSDGEGKEAKWADIDDDEDDWAPETIEWGDGTKTTVSAADPVGPAKSATDSKPSTPVMDIPNSTTELKPTTTFTSTIGPKATVLKLGASAERQQAQKAAQQPKGSMDKTPLLSSQTNPAPPPVKSPWAKLPPVDKISPVEINPQPTIPSPSARYATAAYQTTGANSGMSPAKEMSADDFNRSWKDSGSSQPRELFMPSSGRYEAVPENRRRASRNEQGFRAPAVLQRPGADPRAPEPSAAFQTTRTSSDAARRRASSVVSGGSGQLARRMSIKSGDYVSAFADDSATDSVGGHVMSSEEQHSQSQTPVYQAATPEYVSGGPVGPTDAELEAQRAQQRALMKERIEQARKRKIDEEARLEAEKQERIRQKLASLGPAPPSAKSKAEEEAKVGSEAKIAPGLGEEHRLQAAPASAEAVKMSSAQLSVTSPPKPPQPLATGEPQQYGMMKVHALDTVKKISPPTPQHPQPAKSVANVQNLQPSVEEASPTPPLASAVRSQADSTTTESMPRNRPASAVTEARSSWVRNNHQPPPSSSLWGAPNNRALGNGTFDQTLAGYAPQDLSSRASSTTQGWLNGKTPTVGQSPQITQINQHVPETRSQALQSMTSPDTQPLAINSEVDSMLPVRPPAPIGPPQSQQPPVAHAQHMVNGYAPGQHNSAIAGWNNFHNVARTQERADAERFQREVADRREEEKRSGARQQPNYTFTETFKQVQVGESSSQRQVNNISQSSVPQSNMFGAVGSLPSAITTQSNRGSRFFPPSTNTVQMPDQRRAVTYSYLEVPRSPSPPPAEENDSYHPAYDAIGSMPVVRLPPEKAVVKLPPAKPPTPPSPVQPVVSESPTSPTQPMTWAARVSMPAPKPPAALRSVSTPIVQNPSWQERFNGLLRSNQQETKQNGDSLQNMKYSHPALAIAPVSREPLDVIPAGFAASVSLPDSMIIVSVDDEQQTSKDVEEEEDLFEDREAGSLPIIDFPQDTVPIKWPRPLPHRVMPTPPDVQSAFIYLGSHWKEDKTPKQHFAIIRVPGNDKSVKRDLPMKSATTVSNGRPQGRPIPNSQIRRNNHKLTKPRSTPASTR